MSEQEVYDEAMEAVKKALIAVDACLSTLVLAREVLVDRAQDLNRAHDNHGREQPAAADPMATMGQAADVDCAHGTRMETETMGGTVTFCGDCGEPLGATS